jgi:cytochrome c
MSSTLKLRLILGVVLALVAIPPTVEGQSYRSDYRIGTPATQADIDAWNKDVRPDGMGLPPGSGTFEEGQKLFAEQCAVCHGRNLQGIHDPSLPQDGGPALIGGRGTLNTPKFKITVESYWPYASTLYDYILRAMPYTAPSSLKPDEVYSLVAFILGRANIIDKKTVMDAKSLPKVQMPNRYGFYPDNRPYPVRP